MIIIVCVFVGSTKVLVLTDSTRETRNIKYPGLSFQRKRFITCFLPRILGMEYRESHRLIAYVIFVLTIVLPSHTKFPQALEVANSQDDLYTSCMIKSTPDLSLGLKITHVDYLWNPSSWNK